MRQVKLRAVFMRGVASNAIVFHARDLPEDRARWSEIFLAAIGSPDPNGRQLDGMGGGVSSLSKVCVVGPPSRADADVTVRMISLGVPHRPVPLTGARCLAVAARIEGGVVNARRGA